MAGCVGGREARAAAPTGGPRAWPAPSQASFPRPYGLRQAPGTLQEETALREKTGETSGRQELPAAFLSEGTGVVSSSHYPAFVYPDHVIKGTHVGLKNDDAKCGPRASNPELSQELQQPRGSARVPMRRRGLGAICHRAVCGPRVLQIFLAVCVCFLT